jgi:hypothetical protein
VDFDFYWVIVIFIFVVVPLLEKLLKGAKGAKGPPPQRMPGPPQRMPGPQQRFPPPAQRHLPSREEPAARHETEMDRAAQMIPPELWEILTGQRQAPVATAPPSEADLDEELAEDEEVRIARYDEDAAAEELMRSREREFTQRDRDVALRREVRPVEQPMVVSLETEPLPEPLRHAAFHDAMERRAELAPAAMVLRPKTHELRTLLRNRSDIVRGIVLQEVLGPPKGLDGLE